MTDRDWLRLGCQSLGLYFLVIGLAGIPGIYGIYLSAVDSEYADPASMASVMAVKTTIMLLAGLFLLGWTPSRSPNSRERSTDSSLSLAFGMRLMGLFFTVNGLIELASTVADLFIAGTSWHWRIPEMIGAILSASIGALLFINAERSALWTSRRGAWESTDSNEPHESG